MQWVVSRNWEHSTANYCLQWGRGREILRKDDPNYRKPSQSPPGKRWRYSSVPMRVNVNPTYSIDPIKPNIVIQCVISL